MEETKALVDPLPFVPAIWIGFNRSKSEGYHFYSAWDMGNLGLLAGAHLVSRSATPFDHLWDGLFIQICACLSHGLHDCRIGLQSIEGSHGILQLKSVRERDTCPPQDVSVRCMSVPS